jgi:tetratricopeptide (TPR) repeat protein
MNDVALRLHPEPQVLAAFVEGELRGTEREVVIDHLSDCSDCRAKSAAAAAFGQTESAAPAKFPTWWLAAAAAVVIAVIGGLMSRPQAKGERIVQGDTRQVEGRVTGVGYAPYRPDRGTGKKSVFYEENVIAELTKKVDKNRSVENLHNLGVALLMVGKPGIALASLQEAVQRNPNDPILLNDLAAAELGIGMNREALAHSRSAMDLTSPSPATSPFLAAAFNQALAMGHLAEDPKQHLDAQQAIAAWSKYLEIESSRPWADEAKQKIKDLQGLLPAEGSQHSGSKLAPR